MANTFGLFEGRAESNDRAILDVLSRIPSLDPLLIKAAFRQAGIDVPPAYLSIADEDWAYLRDHVRRKLGPMIRFGLVADRHKSVRVDEVVQNIWDGTDLSGINPLFRHLKINLEDAPSIIYGWKGIVFIEYIYKNKSETYRRRDMWLKEFAIPADVADPQTLKVMETMRDDVRRKIRSNIAVVNSVLDLHDGAQRKLLANGGAPSNLRDVLLACPADYRKIGSALNKIDHCCEIIEKTVNSLGARYPLAAEIDALCANLAEVLK